MDKSSVSRERLTKDNIIKIFFHILRQFDNTYYTGAAASIAYFFFMSIMPSMIVLSQVMGVFDVSLNFIKEWLADYASPQVNELMNELLNVQPVGFTNFVLMLLAIWSASGLQFSLSRMASFTISDGTYRFNFIYERIRAIPYSVITLVTVGFTLVVFVYGEAFLSELIKASIIGKYTVGVINMRVPIALLMFFVMLLVNYYLLPRIRVPIASVIPGTLLSTGGIVVITYFYSLYISHATRYNILYGALANIVALVLWFYLISWVLIIGMMFNKAWDDVMKRGRLTEDKLVTYLKKQYGTIDDKYRKYIIQDDDEFDPQFDTIAVNLSKKFVKGYYAELKAEKKELLKIRKTIKKAMAEIDRSEYVHNEDDDSHND